MHVHLSCTYIYHARTFIMHVQTARTDKNEHKNALLIFLPGNERYANRRRW